MGTLSSNIDKEAFSTSIDNVESADCVPANVMSSNGHNTHEDSSKDEDEKRREIHVNGHPVIEGNSDKEAYLNAILANYHETLARSADKKLGFPICSKCDYQDTLAPFLRFHINNIGTPFTCSEYAMHSKPFEVGVLDWFAKLWQLDKDDYWGYITNGGTEGNLHGLLIGREMLPGGILYASRESHYSIFKAARILKMGCEIISTLVTGEMDLDDLRSRLLSNKDKPAVINLNIGTTFKGAVDDIDLVLETLYACGFTDERFYIHCDAALLGLLVPFVNHVHAPKLTFKKPIGSITISGHKFLGCPMPCGVQITRKQYISVLSRDVEYIASKDATISGGRNGHAAIYLWYALNMKGSKGIQEDVEKCMKNGRYLRDRLRREGISCFLNETSITVIFERPRDEDLVRKWQLCCMGKMANVVVLPGTSIEVLEDFCEELVQKREFWFLNEFSGTPCVASDIGSRNCACALHKMGKMNAGAEGSAL